MQLLEKSVVGLRSAVTKLHRDGGGLRVTVVPMVHVADREFYESVAEIVRGADVCVHEGIKGGDGAWHLDGDRDALSFEMPNRLGLVPQPEFTLRGTRHINFDQGVRSHLAGLAGSKRLGWVVRFAVWLAPAALLWGLGRLLALVRWVLARKTKTRADFVNGLELDTTGRGFQALQGHWLLAKLVDRDQKLHEGLADLDREYTEAGADVVVLYGAAHVPGIFRALESLGYRRLSAEWLTVVRLGELELAPEAPAQATAFVPSNPWSDLRERPLGEWTVDLERWRTHLRLPGEDGGFSYLATLCLALYQTKDAIARAVAEAAYLHIRRFRPEVLAEWFVHIYAMNAVLGTDFRYENMDEAIQDAMKHPFAMLAHAIQESDGDAAQSAVAFIDARLILGQVSPCEASRFSWLAFLAELQLASTVSRSDRDALRRAGNAWSTGRSVSA